MAGDEQRGGAQQAPAGAKSERRWFHAIPSLRRLIVIILITYLSVCLFVVMFQKRLIYFPTPDYPATPTDFGLEFDDLTLTTRDGVSIAAWYIPHHEALGTLLYCHGNAGNISDRLHGIQLLHRMGMNVLIFDYRGYGRSEGKPSEDGTYEDAETAWRYLVEVRKESPQNIVIFGRSLGGAVAIELAKRHVQATVPEAITAPDTTTVPEKDGDFTSPLTKGGLRGVVRSKENLPQPLLGKEGGKKAIDHYGTGTSTAGVPAGSDTSTAGVPAGSVPAGLIVESSFTSLLDIGRLHYPLLPVRLLLTYTYSSKLKVPHITCPKLFLHGSGDMLIPISNGRQLFDAAAQPKQFITTPGDHNGGGFEYSPEFTKHLDEFLRDVLSKP